MQIQNKLRSNYLTSNRLNNVTLEVYSLSLHLEQSDYSLEQSDYLVERSDQWSWNEVTILRCFTGSQLSCLRMGVT